MGLESVTMENYERIEKVGEGDILPCLFGNG